MVTNEFNFAVHPGRILDNYLKTLKMTQKKLAELTQLNKTVINELIKGKRSFTLDIALKLEPIFDMPASYWYNMQNSYNETIKRLKNNNYVCYISSKEIEKLQINCDNTEYFVKSKIILLAI